MKKIVLYTLFISATIVLGGIKPSLAQNSKASNHPGKIMYINSNTSQVEAPSLLGALKIISKGKNIDPLLLKKTILISSVMFDAPAVSPPKGFNIVPDIIQHTGDLGIDIRFLNFPFYTDRKTGKVKQLGNWSSDLKLVINDPSVLFNGYFNKNVYDLYYTKFSDISPYNRFEGYNPHFYYKPEMHRDANNFLIVEGIKAFNEARVVARKETHLIIPVTQKDFIDFTIKLEQLYLKKTKNAIAKVKSDIAYQEKRNHKSWVDYDRKKLQENKKHIPDLEKAIEGNRVEMKKMSTVQLKAPAYVDFYKDSHSIHPYNALAPASDKDRKELVRVNPAYFDRTLPKGAPQVIIVAYHYNRFEAEDIIKKLKMWYNQIDYKKLQAIIK